MLANSSKKSVYILVSSVAFVISVELLCWNVEVMQRLGAECLGLLTIVFGIRYLIDRPPRVPFLEYHLLMMFAFWGVAATGLTGDDYLGLPEWARTKAIWLCVLTATGVAVGFVGESQLGRKVQQGTRDPPLQHVPRLSLPYVIIWVGLVTFLASGKTLLIPISVRLIVVLIASPWPLLTYLAANAHISGRAWTLWVPVIGLSIAGAIGGFISSAVMPIIGACFLVWHIRGRIPLTLLVLVPAVFLVLQPAKATYRSQMWTEGDREVKEDPITALRRWGSAVETAWFDDSPTSRGPDDAMGRLGELSMVAVAAALCPAAIPHDNGRGWVDSASLLVPRIVWPDKPTATDLSNNRFQQVFGLQTRDMSVVTTGAFPIPADAWWNFGWIGVATTGLGLGVLYGWLTRVIGTKSWTRLTISTSLMFSISLTQNVVGAALGWSRVLIITFAVAYAVLLMSDRILAVPSRLPERDTARNH